MTVAALEAEALHRCLLVRRLPDRRGDLPRRFFRAAAKVIDPAWQLAAGGDLALPEIPGHRSVATRMLNRYIARLHRAAEHDSQVPTAFVRVAALLDPPSAIATPRIMARVLAGGHRRGS